MQDRRVIDAQE